jgi:hypothetical protein
MYKKWYNNRESAATDLQPIAPKITVFRKTDADKRVFRPALGAGQGTRR